MKIKWEHPSVGAFVGTGDDGRDYNISGSCETGCYWTTMWGCGLSPSLGWSPTVGIAKNHCEDIETYFVNKKKREEKKSK